MEVPLSAVSILKDALHKAELERDKVSQETKSTREAGAIAQSRVDKLEDDVQDIIEAIDRLERPARFADESLNKDNQEKFDGIMAEMHARPEVEEMQFGGVGITRRKAE
jgi:hypothetical protein